MPAAKARAQESSLDTSNPPDTVFKDTFGTEENNISEEYMLKMAKTWINIEVDIEMINEVVGVQLDSIDNQDQDDVFCIDDDIEDENYFLIVTEEENNSTKMEIMDCLENIQSYWGVLQ